MTTAFTKLLSLTVPPLLLSNGTLRLILAAGVIALGVVIAWLPVKFTALLICGAVVLVLLLQWPLLSLYLLIPIIPFSSLLAVSLGGFRVGLMEIMLAAGLIAWLLQEITRTHYPQWAPAPFPDRPVAPLVVPLLLFLGCVALS